MKPDDIPQWAWDDALACVDVVAPYCDRVDYDSGLGRYDATARALMTERERCAQMVNDEAERQRCNKTSASNKQAMWFDLLAARIRSKANQ